MEVTTESVCADPAVEAGILKALQDRIGPQRFNAWFRHGTRLNVENGHIKVAVPNSFVANWIENHFSGDIAFAGEDITGVTKKVMVTVDPELTGELRKKQLDNQADMVHKAAEGRARPRSQPQPLPLRYNLKDLVVGESNKLAYSAALAMCKSKQSPLGQLFVHGSCGVGKTHMLQGICNVVSRSRNGRAACRYVTGEQFTNEFITAVRRKTTDEFRSRYRKLDLLAIDDVHFLAAKRATQDEFLHTFNAIESAGKRIVLASDAHPRMVGDLNEQLVSRFLAGMVVKIDSPDKDLRARILRGKARAMKFKIPESVVDYVASYVHGSGRELEGALVKLAAVAALENEPVTVSMANDTLGDFISRAESSLTLGDIEAAVSTYFGITPADLHSTRRTRTVSTARMIAMFLARRHTQMSFPEIAKFMGKNHSSVILAVQRMEKLLAEGGDLKWMTPLGPRSMRAVDLLEMLNGQFN